MRYSGFSVYIYHLCVYDFFPSFLQVVFGFGAPLFPVGMAASEESEAHKPRLSFPAWKGLDIGTPDWGLECGAVSKLAHPAESCVGN